jgi:hypothetical protein
MSDFTVRADHIDVEHIMRQIRARIRDKRGADYTEAEIRELASVKLDRFLDPRAVRSDLLQHFRRQHRPEPTLASEPEPPLYAFEPEMVYASSRGLGQILRFIRRLLNPIFKLFFNPNPLFDVVHRQGSINQYVVQGMHRFERLSRTRDELDALNFEMFNNLVVEVTRLGIEVKNLRMLVESLSTRLAFDERRARALEGVVQYRPGSPLGPPVQDEAEDGGEEGEGRGTRRRRRRRGRRRGPGSGAEVDSGERPLASAGGGGEDAPTPPTGTAEPSAAPNYPDEAEPADREKAGGSGAAATEPTGSDSDTHEPSES